MVNLCPLNLGVLVNKYADSPYSFHVAIFPYGMMLDLLRGVTIMQLKF
jgi:hypothetical protein